jgi:hypothetical protein
LQPFAGFGFELLGWVRQRERWRALYAWYIALYAVWLFVHTFTYRGLRRVVESCILKTCADENPKNTTGQAILIDTARTRQESDLSYRTA